MSSGTAGDVDLLAAVSKRTQSAVGAQAVEAQAVRLRRAADAVAVLDSAAASETLPPDARLWAGLALTQAGKAPKVALQKLKGKAVATLAFGAADVASAVLLELVQKGDETTEKQLQNKRQRVRCRKPRSMRWNFLALAGKTTDARRICTSCWPKTAASAASACGVGPGARSRCRHGRRAKAPN